jgi:hypothetical protein
MRCCHDIQQGLIKTYVNLMKPVTVAKRSEAWTVFRRTDAGTVGLNPTHGMDV